MAGPPNLRCPLCGSGSFETRPGSKGEWSLSFLGLGQDKRPSTELICHGCRYVMTFADPV